MVSYAVLHNIKEQLLEALRTVDRILIREGQGDIPLVVTEWIGDKQIIIASEMNDELPMYKRGEIIGFLRLSGFVANTKRFGDTTKRIWVKRGPAIKPETTEAPI